MPILALVDRLVEELSIVKIVGVGVGVVFDEKLCVVCVDIGEELCVMTDDGKSQPLTWIPYTADSVCTVEVDVLQE